MSEQHRISGNAIGAVSIVLLAMLAGLSTTNAATLLPVEKQLSDVGKWKVYRDSHFRGCIGESIQEDGTIFLLGVRITNGNLLVGFSNERLKFATTGKRYDLKLLFDGKRPWNTNFHAIQPGSQQLLFGDYGKARKFRSQISRSSSLQISRKGKRLASLSLKGTSRLFKALNECRTAMQGSVARLQDENSKLVESDHLNKEALKLYRAGKYAEARPLFQKTLALREEVLGPDHARLADSLNNLAITLKLLGDLNGSELRQRRALAMRKKLLGLEHADTADSLNNLGNILLEQGKFDDAEASYRQALAVREKILAPGHADIGESQNNLAILLKEKGAVSEAEALYRQALAIREKALGPEHRDVGSSLDNIAILLADNGRFDEAEALYRRALAIREKALGLDHPEVGNSLNNLGNLLFQKKEFVGAEPFHRRALQIRKASLGQEHPSVADSLNNLAILRTETKQPKDAEILNQQALTIRQKVLGPEHPDVAQSLNNLANALKDQGKLEAAKPLYYRALKIRETLFGSEHPDVGQSLNNLAVLLERRKDFAGAEPLYRRALGIRKKIFDPGHPSVGESFNNLANLMSKRGDFPAAVKLARTAAQSGNPRRSTYLHNLVKVEWSRQEKHNESLKAIQLTSASSSGVALQNLAARFSAGTTQLAELVRSEQDDANELKRLNQSLFNELTKPRDKRDFDNEGRMRERIKELGAQIKTVRAKLSSGFPEFTELRRPKPLSVSETQALLSGDEAVIIIDIADKGEGNDYVWAVTSKDTNWQQLKTKQGEVAVAISKLRSGLDLGLEANRKPIFPADAHHLYQKILGPVANIVSDKKHLIFVLNGAVSSFPPHLLVTEQPASTDFRAIKWLVKDHAISVLPTISSLKFLRSQTRTSRAPKPLRAYGDPVFNQEEERRNNRDPARAPLAFYDGKRTSLSTLRNLLPRLPGTTLEVESVAQSLGAQGIDISLREKATETAIKQDQLDQYNIIYFATHGLVAGQVEQFAKSGAEPALAFTLPEEATSLDDGLLTASEIAQLKLNADWVVLSACNTASGNQPGADALSGLARAFFYAGSRSVLVTHWVVDDIATAELMSRTFAHHSKNPKDRPAEALRQAMLSIMNDPANPHWADPVYWAPFILVGEPRTAE